MRTLRGERLTFVWDRGRETKTTFLRALTHAHTLECVGPVLSYAGMCILVRTHYESGWSLPRILLRGISDSVFFARAIPRSGASSYGNSRETLLDPHFPRTKVHPVQSWCWSRRRRWITFQIIGELSVIARPAHIRYIVWKITKAFISSPGFHGET